MVRRRTIGPDGPEVSQICYGAMRLAAEVDRRSAADHLCLIHDSGIDTIHSSHEYPTDPVLLDALRSASATGRRFQHIVKLAEPSFDDHRFDAGRLEAVVDRRLADLGTDRLACIQWMIRTPTPEDDSVTLPVLEEGQQLIIDCLDRLIASGKIGSMALFPYTRATAESAIDRGVAKALAVYLNRTENAYTDLADRCQAVVAIRPLAGGSLAEGGSEAIADALRYPLLHPSVATAILSFNSAKHLEAAVSAAGSTAPDRDRFEAFLASGLQPDGQ